VVVFIFFCSSFLRNVGGLLEGMENKRNFSHIGCTIPPNYSKKKKARKREKPLASKMFNLVAETHVQ
jgi:hypothetical protein